MLDFNNTEIAFSAKSQSELKNAYLLFNTIKYPWLVKCASVVSNIALNIHFPLGWAVKPTLYKQFVGGETLQIAQYNYLKANPNTEFREYPCCLSINPDLKTVTPP